MLYVCMYECMYECMYMLALHPVFTGWYNAEWASFLCAALSKLSIVYVYCIPPAEANPIHPS